MRADARQAWHRVHTMTTTPTTTGAAPARHDRAAPTAGAPTVGRLAGIDVARAVALLGMVTVHFGPDREVGSGLDAFVYHSFYGKASVLFALVAGVGVGLMCRRDPPLVVRVRMLYRALWLIPVGLALQRLDHPVAVILQYYGLYFVGAIPFVGRRRRTLLAGAALTLLAGSATVLWALVNRPDWMVRMGGQAPLDPFGDLVLGGYYPAITWVPVLAFGMWLAQLDLRSGRAQAAMVVGGAATLAVTRWVGVTVATAWDLDVTRGSWGYAAAVSGHSEMPLAVLGAVGFATAVIGAGLAVAARWPRLSHPMAALGRLALSIYVGHLLVYAWVPDLFPATTVPQGIRHVLWFGVATAAFSTLWLWIFPRGPLEAVVRWPWQRVAVRLRRIAAGAEGTPPP